MEAISMAHTGGTTHTVTDKALQEFQAFFRKYSLRVEGFLINQGATRHDAEDATQQAMHDLFRRWTLIQQPRSWVYRAAEGHLRRNAYRQRREQAHPGVQLACDIGTARSVWDGLPMRQHDFEGSSEETRRVIALLQQLPPVQRRVMAFKLDGFEAPEIADMIGRPVGTVRSNIRHARARLAQALQADPVPTSAQAGGSYATGRAV
ncbi:RNA polymerase sigma factor [Micromonospora sp. NPDC049048]|uniref:RNA polymerase sigma factor n=1 Tax=Micromonospora sp. NPDC049048 TaxID=3364263 RepID=UPI003715E6E4